MQQPHAYQRNKPSIILLSTSPQILCYAFQHHFNFENKDHKANEWSTWLKLIFYVCYFYFYFYCLHICIYIIATHRLCGTLHHKFLNTITRTKRPIEIMQHLLLKDWRINVYLNMNSENLPLLPSLSNSSYFKTYASFCLFPQKILFTQILSK